MRTRRQQFSSDPMPSGNVHRNEGTEGQGDAATGKAAVPGQSGHVSVLLQEVIDSLELRPADVVLDATLGGAGHAKAIADILGENGVLIGIDADSAAIERARKALEAVRPRVILAQGNFRKSQDMLVAHGIREIDKALFDLGWSSYHLQSGRGFSFLKDEPLLMTYDENPASDAVTAEKIVNEWEEQSIADILYGWGEERFSRRIAHVIVQSRKRKPIKSSFELGEIVGHAVPRKGRIHPATKTFQALRIAVNDEIGALKEGLTGAWKKLKEGGRLAVISFHSVEDREVKHLFNAWAKDNARRITKSPITPGKEELRGNPRSRSAKLRIIEKISPDSEA